MNKGFWEKLPRPIVGLSPMDGVTDAPMRLIAKKYGQPDVIYTEFVSVEGLWRIQKRGETTHKIWNELKYNESEQPVVAQLFGSDPDSFYEATKIVAKMGFAGIDINMGCPSPGLEKRGGGSGLMRDPGLAHRVIEAVRKGVADMGIEIPVSVKTRIGSSRPDKEWWEALAKEELPAVAMHGRTFKQLYSGEADWEVLREASKIIRESGALFLGNGDVEKILGNNKVQLVSERVFDLDDDFDGVLVGRKAVGNPWTMRRDGYEPSFEERLKVALEHARVFEMNLPGNKFEIMRKHLTWYAHGFDGAGGLRRKLVVSSSADEVEKIIAEFLDTAQN
ncbi:MAG TPA: tRNA-dihydrouridine synthase [Spirochaetia bacterium]|nr:tRNA-dihydrouridine synthase [Spirochaetia bacterium]